MAGRKKNDLPPTAPSPTPVAQADVPSVAPDAPTDNDLGDTQPDDGGQGANEDAPVAATTSEIAVVIEAFVAWAKSDNPEADYEAFVKAALLNDDHALTDEGCAILDAEGVPYRVLNFLTLGVPVTYITDQGKHHVEAGSTLRIKHGGSGNDGVKFWVCDAGEMLPETVVYQHRLHVVSSHRYPISQPIVTTYKTGA